MKYTDISIIEDILLAKKFGDHAAASELMKGISPPLVDLLDPYINQHITSEYSPVLTAWKSFYRHAWEESLNLFTASLLDDSTQGLAALGIGRIATKHGKWDIARQWLWYAILESRQKYDDFLLMQCHGAMGELMLRTQHYHESLKHMQLAYSLCPAGHPQRKRQYSYLGMPLARLGKCQVAEGYYMSAYYLAMDQHDHISAMHALVRRGALVLYDYDVPLANIKQTMDDLNKNNTLKNYGSRTPLDYLNIILFWHQWKNTGYKDLTLIQHIFEGSPWELNIIASIQGLMNIESELHFPSIPSNVDIIDSESISMEDVCIVNKVQTPEHLQYCLKTFFI